MPAFDAVCFQVNPYAIGKVIADRLPPRPPKQSGAVLKSIPELQALLAGITAHVSRMFGCRMYLRLDKSSYRVQTPDGDGALYLHQDYMPLQDPVTRRLHFDGGVKKFLVGLKEGLPKLTDPTQEPSATVWLPLDGIDEHTPTLALCPVTPPYFIPHKTDEAGYAILADDTGWKHWPLVEVTQLPRGYGIVFGPLTLHKSAVHTHHSKSRRSMDLRFLPRPMK